MSTAAGGCPGSAGSGVRRLAELHWPEVDAGAATWILVVPVGATEQHGPHLPIGTDSLVAAAVCDGLAGRRPDVVVAPTLPYGSSGEHAAFPGTLSVGQGGLETAVLELVRSADRFAGTVLVSGHGGNAAPLARAAERSRADGRLVLAWWPRTETLEAVTGAGSLASDAHAGRVETSLLLWLAPGLVGPVPPDPDPPDRSLAELMPVLRRSGVASVSLTGVLGTPGRAAAAEGQALLDALVTDLDRVVDQWLTGADTAHGSPRAGERR